MPLSNLPVELFEIMAGNLNKSDLMSLRLVERDCAAKVMKPYKEIAFRELNVCINSEPSLKQAFKVADTYGACVQEVNVWINEWSDLAPMQYESQLRIRGVNTDGFYLTHLLSKLKGFEKLKHVTLKIDPKDKPQRFGLAYPPFAGRGLKVWRAPRLDSIRPMKDAFEAIALSGLQLHSFAMDTPGVWSMSVHELMLNKNIVSHMIKAMSFVKFLALDMWFTDTTEPEAEALCRHLAALPNLEILLLASRFEWDGPLFDEFQPWPWSLGEAMETVRFASLKRLSLFSGHFFFDSLVTIVKAHPKLDLMNLDGGFVVWPSGAHGMQDPRDLRCPDVLPTLKNLTGFQNITTGKDGIYSDLA